MSYGPAPRYDHTKDGNPFYWILASAQKTREEREATDSRRKELNYRTFRRDTNSLERDYE